jgi:hypothetical protein
MPAHSPGDALLRAERAREGQILVRPGRSTARVAVIAGAHKARHPPALDEDRVNRTGEAAHQCETLGLGGTAVAADRPITTTGVPACHKSGHAEGAFVVAARPEMDDEEESQDTPIALSQARESGTRRTRSRHGARTIARPCR